LSIFCKLSSAGSAATAASAGAGDRRRAGTLCLGDLAAAFFFRDCFVFDFLALVPERFVGFLFGLAMAIDPYLTLNQLYAGCYSSRFCLGAQTTGACSHDPQTRERGTDPNSFKKTAHPYRLLALLVLTRPANIDYFHQLLGSESLPEEDIKMATT
jgi:hypothetical protein